MGYIMENILVNLKKEIQEIGGGGGGGGPEMPDDYITTGLTCEGCEIVAGGYYKIGQCVFVNMEIVATASGNLSISGFPTYSSLSENDIALCNAYDQSWGDPLKNVKISKSGVMAFTGSGDWHYILTASYLCDPEEE